MRMGGAVKSRIAAGVTLATAARCYWLGVFPQICRELCLWQRRAGTIPDCPLRRMALTVQHTKRGNIEGSAAFAAFAPRVHRPAVVRAQLAFQAIYDYVDTLAEQPHTSPIRNARQLHRALLAALKLGASEADYYKHHPYRDDGGYLRAITDACGEALSTLPCYPTVAGSTHQLAKRIVAYQSLNLTKAQGSHCQLAVWATGQTPPETELRWWETAASAGSSLGIFALMATAARTSVSPQETAAIERAYFPWVGSLHSLLDSLIDLPEDAATEQPNLIEHYCSPRETAVRLQTIAAESAHRVRALPRGLQHAVILAGMASHYLSAHEAEFPHARLAKAAVLEAIGDFGGATMLILRLRRAAHTRPMMPASSTSSLPPIFLYRSIPRRDFSSATISASIPARGIRIASRADLGRADSSYVGRGQSAW
jgi:tetraprenyl-beta-curcumene synthase